jgi:hypothetical protein
MTRFLVGRDRTGNRNDNSNCNCNSNSNSNSNNKYGILRLRCSESAVSNFAQDDEVFGGPRQNGQRQRRSNWDDVSNGVGDSKNCGESGLVVLAQRREMNAYQGLWASLKIPSKAGQ